MAATLYLPISKQNKIPLHGFPSFSASGSIKGMKKHYYGEDALLVRSGSFIYKVDQKTYERVKFHKYA